MWVLNTEDLTITEIDGEELKPRHCEVDREEHYKDEEDALHRRRMLAFRKKLSMEIECISLKAIIEQSELMIKRIRVEDGRDTQ